MDDLEAGCFGESAIDARPVLVVGEGDHAGEEREGGESEEDDLEPGKRCGAMFSSEVIEEMEVTEMDFLDTFRDIG